MKHLLWWPVPTVALTFWLLGTPAGAQQKADPKAGAGKSAASPANPDVEEKALSIFNKMATFLSQAPKLSVTIESGYDAVQPSGLKVEFGQRLLRSARNDALALCQAVEVLSHSPYIDNQKKR
jgi:hypothetical protein